MPIGTVRLNRTQLVLSTLVLSFGLVAGLFAAIGPAVARVPSKDGIYLGAAGDKAALATRTGEPIAAHQYGFFESRPENGRMLSVKFRNFKSWQATAALAPGSTGYQQIAGWADALKSRTGDILVAFHHEPEATGNKKYGTATEYKNAFRKVVSIFRARGATNVSFTWQMTAYAFAADATAYNHAAKWYPGDAYVDVVATDPYNWYTCGHGKGRWKSLKDLTGPSMQFARSHGKQLAIAEFASVADSRRPAWIREAGQYLAANDDVVVAAFYFNRAPTNPVNADCTWALKTDADFAAFREIARMPVMNH